MMLVQELSAPLEVQPATSTWGKRLRGPAGPCAWFKHAHKFTRPQQGGLHRQTRRVMVTHVSHTIGLAEGTSLDFMRTMHMHT